MYFTRSASTGYRFRCSFSKCEAAVPNNTLVMLAHLSQHFRVRIAGDFSQNGSVVGHRRTCKSLPLTINQVGAHFTLSDREEASLHAGEVQMAYVCQWRNCNRTRTFKKGLITHLYRHVSFHLISESQHAALKEKSKPLKLSSAQFVPHGSGTKLITESMNSSHGLNFDKSKCPKLLGLLNEKADPDNPQLSQGNYGTGSPLGSLIDKLASQLMKSDGGPSSPLVTIDDSSNKKPSTVPKEGETLSRAAYRKGKFPHYQMGLSVSSPSCGPGPKKIVTPRVPGVSNEKSSKNDEEEVQGKDGTLADDVNSTKSPLDGKRKRQDDEINPQSEGDEPTTKKTKAEDETRSGDAESHHSKAKEDDDVQNPEGKTDSPLLCGSYEATSGEINAQEKQQKSGDGSSSFEGDDSPEAPCLKEQPKLGKQSKDVPMPHLDFVGPDDTDEKSTDKASRSPPDLPKLDFIGDS
ncbi:hypothetical protein BSL78_20524 [Apostichopus japonicus]|uniref:Uncharacterized protein n=1 Tax=Stichopus japonicus TaxID=307972 RepID=A0A2G8K3P9_STIJA|nr:hypothetical protein BSL78_20524 [Apostichopus japonicus]